MRLKILESAPAEELACDQRMTAVPREPLACVAPPVHGPVDWLSADNDGDAGRPLPGSCAHGAITKPTARALLPLPDATALHPPTRHTRRSDLVRPGRSRVRPGRSTPSLRLASPERRLLLEACIHEESLARLKKHAERWLNHWSYARCNVPYLAVDRFRVPDVGFRVWVGEPAHIHPLNFVLAPQEAHWQLLIGQLRVVLAADAHARAYETLEPRRAAASYISNRLSFLPDTHVRQMLAGMESEDTGEFASAALGGMILRQQKCQRLLALLWETYIQLLAKSPGNAAPAGCARAWFSQWPRALRTMARQVDQLGTLFVRVGANLCRLDPRRGACQAPGYIQDILGQPVRHFVVRDEEHVQRLIEDYEDIGDRANVARLALQRRLIDWQERIRRAQPEG